MSSALRDAERRTTAVGAPRERLGEPVAPSARADLHRRRGRVWT